MSKEVGAARPPMRAVLVGCCSLALTLAACAEDPVPMDMSVSDLLCDNPCQDCTFDVSRTCVDGARCSTQQLEGMSCECGGGRWYCRVGHELLCRDYARCLHSCGQDLYCRRLNCPPLPLALDTFAGIDGCAATWCASRGDAGAPACALDKDAGAVDSPGTPVGACLQCRELVWSPLYSKPCAADCSMSGCMDLLLECL